MKIFVLLAIACVICRINASTCTCSQLQSQTDCTLQTECFWNGSSCANATCANLSETNCRATSTSVCYFNDSKCNEVSSCSQITVTDTTGAATCASYGCGFTAGQTSCSTLSCSSLTSATCSSAYIWANNSLTFCYMNGENCEAITSSTACSSRTSQTQCLLNDSSCGWVVTGLLTGTCYDKGCSNTQATTSALCSTTLVNNGMCQFNNGECTLVELNQSCSSYSFQAACQTALYCTWDNEACVNNTCALKTCSGTTVGVYPSGSYNNWIFCQNSNDVCTSVSSNDVGATCNTQTLNHYTWNGTSCSQCTSAISLAFSLLFLLALALIV